MIDKLEAAGKQIECAVRLVAAEEDVLAVHTLDMAAFGILSDLAKGSIFYEAGLKPYLTKIGTTHLSGMAAFLSHANRDPEGILAPFDPPENDWRLGFCLLLYRSLTGTFTPTMAAFHCWMIVRHPDHFMLAEDPDIEQAYREAISFQREQGRGAESLLNVLLKVFGDGLLPPNIGFARRGGNRRST